MDTKNQNQPNYDFILQQQVATDPNQNQPKNKKALIIIVLIALTVFGTGLLFILERSQNLAPADNINHTSSSLEFSNFFLDNVSSGNLSQAVDVLDSEFFDNEIIASFVIDRLSSSINENSCILIESQNTGIAAEVAHTYLCEGSESFELIVVVSFQDSQNSYIISEVRLENV